MSEPPPEDSLLGSGTDSNCPVDQTKTLDTLLETDDAFRDICGEKNIELKKQKQICVLHLKS